MTAREGRRDELFDLLVSNPGGLNVNDMMDQLGFTHKQVNEAIHDLRAYLGEYDSINLPCQPQGRGERWLYQLVGTFAGVRDWTANRVGDSESRIRTMQSMLTSIVSATDGRTNEGKRARTMERALRRLVEDLDDIAT